MKIVLVAQEAAGVAALRLVRSSPHDLCAVLTGTDAGEGAERGVTVASVARRSGVPVLPAHRVREPAFGAELRRQGVDVLLNVHSLYLIAEEVLVAPRVGGFNLHPGPLPGYAGLNVPSWALYHGERRHGVTLHWMAPRVDAGPIAFDASFDLGPADTALSVSATCARLGLSLIAELIGRLDRDPPPIPAVEQDLTGRRWYGRGVPHEGWVPWTLPARRVVGFVQACDYGPWPSPWGEPRTLAGGAQVTVVRAARTGEPTDRPPGTVVGTEGSAVLVAAADEWVRVLRTRVDGASVPPRESLPAGVVLAPTAAPEGNEAPGRFESSSSLDPDPLPREPRPGRRRSRAFTAKGL